MVSVRKKPEVWHKQWAEGLVHKVKGENDLRKSVGPQENNEKNMVLHHITHLLCLIYLF